MVDWKAIMRWGSKVNASDIFWKPGAMPHARIQGRVQKIPEQEPLSPDDTEAIARELMDDEDWKEFRKYPEKDIGLTIGDDCRLRINVYQERENVALVMRIIPLDIMTIDELDLPEVLQDIALKPQGLVLVTGPTGCGKSTTLAAMLDLINRKRQAHIVTIEDPIEYVHKDKKSIVSQRAVGIDTDDFQDALKYAMRQSPDVILIGEMRDVTTMSVAMQAAETGHLVFSTVHTTSAAETMERIVNMFPPHDKPQICMRMSKSLQAVISQSLVPRKETGRIAAVEVMVVTPTVSKYIEEGKIGETYEAIQEGEHWGMQTMNQSLLKLYKDDIITADDAMFYAGNYTEMRQMLRRVDGLAKDKAQEDAEKRAKQKRMAQARKRQNTGQPSGSGEGGG
ncbi:MAG: PilT/PilU family type 4a pilus ATPase [Armatimonadota bacterium]